MKSAAVLFLGLASAAQAPVHTTLRDLRARLDAYERRATESGRPDPAELASIANAIIEQARGSTTFPVWSNACASIAVPDSSDCSSRLWAIVKATREPIATRARAASALMARGEAPAADVLAGQLKTAPASTLARLVPAITTMPAPAAVPLLVRLSESPAGDDQQQACEALSAFDVTESRVAMARIVEANPPGSPPWLVCMIARARLHDPTPPGAVAGYGNMLQGRGQLFAARVMLELGSDAAVPLLVDLTHRGDSIDRLAAADLLVDVRPDAAIPIVEAAEANPDSAIRAAALLSERRLKRPPSKSVRSMLLDTDGIVRVRAAEVAIDWAKRSQNH
jgi:HEAT repeat protein